MPHALLVAIVPLLAWPLARADVVDIKWSGDGHFAHEGAVAPGKFTEVCGKLPSGTSVLWNFESSAPVDFNVHYHVGKEVVFPSKLAAVATARGTLQTTIAQDYCWMWSNKSAAQVELKVKLERQ